MAVKLTIGERIDDLIKDTGKNAETIASDLSISKATMSDIINNVDKGYNYKYFVALAQYFNVSTDYLLCLTDSKTTLNTDDGVKLRISCDYTGLNQDAIERIVRDRYNVILYSDLSAIDYIDYVSDDDNTQEKYKQRFIDDSPILKEYKTKYSNIVNDFITSGCFYRLLDKVLALLINYQNLINVRKIGNGDFQLFEKCNNLKEIEMQLRLIGEFDSRNYEKLQKLCIYECQEEITAFYKKYVGELDLFSVNSASEISLLLKTEEIIRRLILNNVFYDNPFCSKEEYLSELKRLYEGEI